jgi:hypothetical protein
VGRPEVGDDVVVNVEAAELGLGSGGFDVVHVNLTRGLDEQVPEAPRVMKLNYTSLQHAVEPVEATDREELSARPPVLALMLHGQLAPAVWAFAQTAPGLRVGYVQTAGGALTGTLSRTVSELRRRELLAGHVTAGTSFGGEQESISVLGGIHAAASHLGWDAVVAGPGPGILGSNTSFGHGGMAALDTAHAALALGLPALLAARMSSADPRDRHRGVSHHTRVVLELLLGPVQVAVSGVESGTESLRQAAAGGRHELLEVNVDLDGYAASGLPSETMGRSLREDPDFFSAALAAGNALGLAVEKTRD